MAAAGEDLSPVMTSTLIPAFLISLATELAYSSISGAMVRMRAWRSQADTGLVKQIRDQ